jgi:hypothetical protein
LNGRNPSADGRRVARMSSKSRTVVVCASVAIFSALALLPFGPAAAQGFLEGLFGSDTPASPRPAAGYVRRQPFGSSTYAPISPYAPYSDTAPHSRPLGLFSPYQAYAPYDQPLAPDTGAYRTLCVRMCDGFYFPISYATSSAAFDRDAEACTAACGGDARLFYYPNPGGNIEDMVDLMGRAYASYPTAFRYRKTLVKGCQCRPQPWSEAERARHRAYASGQTPLAGPSDSGTAAANPSPASSAPDEDGAGQALPLLPIDRSGFTSPAPSPAVSPYIAGAPPPVAARRNLRADAPEPQTEQWGWSSGEADPGTARRKTSPAWNSGR